MVTRREEQIAENEALFRVINERLACWSENRDPPASDRIDFYCECGDKTCFERVALSLSDYENLRRDPARFVVVPGHVFPEVERIVEQRHIYAVVEKNENLRRIVEGTDPRRRRQLS